MEEILQYLRALNENNEREWYHAHKEEHKNAMAVFEDLVFELSKRISKLEGQTIYQMPKELIYRVPRDIRFSKDKRPYNPSFRAHFSPYGKELFPLGYYLTIEPGGKSFIAAGFHASSLTAATNQIRDYMAERGQEFEKIVTSSRFTKFFTLEGERLKSPPRGYDPDHPQIDYLQNKSWYVGAALSDEQVLSDDLFDLILERCEAMKPLKDYLNLALDGFEMPKRGK